MAAHATTAPARQFALIVKLQPNSGPAAAAVLRAAGVSPLRAAGAATIEIAPATYLVRASGSDASSAARTLARQPGVAYAEPNQIYRAEAARVVPNDPCYTNCAQGSQWYLTSDRATNAWGVTRGSADITVAVLDTGVKVHPDLSGKITNGPNYANPDDFCGTVGEIDHGTLVAGIIGARTGNAAGIAGLGWNTHILSVGVLNAKGCGTTSSIVQGLRYAADRHARVINMSLGGPPSQAVGDAVRYAQAHGALVVAAAGNEGWTFPEYPAAYDGVLAVAATTHTDHIATFSNRGSWVDIAAPGVDILSTTLAGNVATYAELDGTSFSAPQVSATAALLLAANPCISSADIATRLEATARALPGGGVQSGILDAGHALTPPVRGFRVAAADGGVFSSGGVCYYGSAATVGLRSPVVGMTSTTTDTGYWLVASDGGVFSFGNARFAGAAASLPLVKPIVAMQATPSGRGYWLVASDGGVFSYGDARFFGSTGNLHLTRPVLGMAVTPTGRGYWLVASDGGIFAFGDARFFGSTGALALVSPITGMTAAPDGRGYLLVGGDGGVFAFGAAMFHGSAVAAPGAPFTTSIAMTHTGRGYWILHADGSVRAFGDATPYGPVPARGAVTIVAARSG
ncbi:MAG: peptidase and in kexin sedolisin [Actinomycetia bacterium]|nr:peptidase and in kexin sedolisin [Actinomycetes bacterium]